MAKYKKGHIFDPQTHTPASFSILRVGRRVGATPTGAASLAAFAPAPMDQGSTSSCTGHACAGAIATTLAAKNQPLGFVPSPAGIYTLARAVDRTPSSSGRAPALIDDGAMPSQAWKGISTWGVRPMQAPTPDGRNSDADPATIDNEPLFSDLLLDAKHLFVGEYRIDSTGAQRVTDFCLALDAGYAVTAAVFVDTAFETWSEGLAPIGRPNMADRDGGWHYIYFIGYRTEGDTRIFRFRNSWGTSWGKNGDGECDEGLILTSGDAYVASVTPK